MSMLLTYIISIPFTIIIGLVYIYLIMGWVLFPALAAFLLLMIINIIVVKKGLYFQKNFMKLRSDRVKVTNDVFNNIKFVKSYSLEHFFTNKIMQVRNEELRWLSYVFYRIIYSITNSDFSPGVFLFVLFVVYVAFGYELTSGKIFTTISIFNSFIGALTYLPNLFSNFIDIMISSERLTNFLVSPDIEKFQNKFEKKYKLTEEDEQNENLFNDRFVEINKEVVKAKEESESFIDEIDAEEISEAETIEDDNQSENKLNLFLEPYYSVSEKEDTLPEESLIQIDDARFSKNSLDLQIKNLDFVWKKFWIQEEEEKIPTKTEKPQKKLKHSESNYSTFSKISEKTLISKKSEITEQIDEKFRLKNINIEIKKGEFVCILGKSGSGKSSLLLSVLGELFAINSGEFQKLKKENNEINFDNEPEHLESLIISDPSELNFNPNLSYLSQKPWIRNATLRENILMGNKYEKKHYDKCVKYSGLVDDLEILNNGDQTIIGDRGINLSGGQKTRVALARALYSNSQLFLLDDPLSALDVNVGDHVFRKAFCGFLKHKTRVIVTHNLGYLKFFDRIIFMDQGRILFNGPFDQLKDKSFYIGE